MHRIDISTMIRWVIYRIVTIRSRHDFGMPSECVNSQCSKGCISCGIGEEEWRAEILYRPEKAQYEDCEGCLQLTKDWWNPGETERILCLLISGFEVWILAGGDWWRKQEVYSLHLRTTWLLWVQQNAIWSHQCTCNISEIDGELFGEPESELVYHLPGWCSGLCSKCKGTFEEIGRSFQETQGCWTQVETKQVSTLQEIHLLLRSCSFRRGSAHRPKEDWDCSELGETYNCPHS